MFPATTCQNNMKPEMSNHYEYVKNDKCFDISGFMLFCRGKYLNILFKLNY